MSHSSRLNCGIQNSELTLALQKADLPYLWSTQSIPEMNANRKFKEFL